MKGPFYILPLVKMASKRSLDLCQTPPSKRAKVVNSPARNFKETWKIGNPWLRYDFESKLMFCDSCIKVQKTNTFTTGCQILKKENVTKHASSKGNLNKWQTLRNIFCLNYNE